jgi:cytidylate kinase|tara:strand:+ start:498 stop:998 length:501 start_codon:yes stop_codon:yes gene_type:complete
MKIAIYGPMCSGKSTVASIIKKMNPEYKIYSFGQKIKDIATELFNMEDKNRSLLISIADKMRDIDEDVWVKYIMNQTNDHEYCIIDDLRFQNELNYLSEWNIICLTTPEDVRLERIKEIYPKNSEDHIKNMKHKSETDRLQLPNNTYYIDTSIPYDELEKTLLSLF